MNSDLHFVMPVSSAGTLAGDPLADNFTGDTDTDVVCMMKYKTAYFMIFWGVGTTGALTLTVIPCDNATPSNETTAIPFLYKRCSGTETNTAWAWSSSLLTTVASSEFYILKVMADTLTAVSGVQYEYVKVHIVESEDHPLLGGCIIMMADPRYPEDALDAVTA